MHHISHVGANLEALYGREGQNRRRCTLKQAYSKEHEGVGGNVRRRGGGVGCGGGGPCLPSWVGGGSYGSSAVHGLGVTGPLEWDFPGHSFNMFVGVDEVVPRRLGGDCFLRMHAY